MSKLTGKERRELFKAASLFTQIAITIATCVFLGVFIGRFLDNGLGTEPWLLLVFAAIGVGAAFKSLYEIFKKFM
ncbi:MAG: AtpZ/AtpI family protein [Defluviitaleaceae bacterium]|nr:AtpZ/AtpI family protein [Defluviitaleaceae bacterium]